MPLPQSVKLVEVGPRDGLQNESKFIPTELKIEFINQLSKSGLGWIEVTSFVSAKKIPQLADHQQVYQQIAKDQQIAYPVLVPNLQGFNNAMTAGVKHIAVFGSASEQFSKKNIHCSRQESLTRFAEVIHHAKQHAINIRGYISCCFGCPYENEVTQSAVIEYADKLFKLGCNEICLGDTTGQATPLAVQTMLKQMQQIIPRAQIAMHFHDTYGQAIANIFASLQSGINIFDCSVSGLGGCPYAPGASGNVATEDVIYLLQGLGISVNIDVQQLMRAVTPINQFLGRETLSKYAQAVGS